MPFVPERHLPVLRDLAQPRRPISGRRRAALRAQPASTRNVEMDFDLDAGARNWQRTRHETAID
ncbi:hypothetical protein [Tahibacter caeni]|uniref:hypothetical protein n=1 Tax=Tahibacter caeni TaxID=1453545 RepID=UPI002147238A|nr:hypothetical protein [Tahibacter caeni]